ncbi:hypothetical protein DSO57_1008474 [Entomophthora muscae]|uniref:Uncharacterized protein n=1 Tax=Entomophthora muscae TaxID=34485 RepID=A0ACC2SVW8_9FUNG|nr:hypothetical protein DSO57_1008474 [Entomophthora muscae]
MLEDLPDQAQDVFITSENVVRSLVCDNLDLSALELVPSMVLNLNPSFSTSSEIPVPQAQEEDPGGQVFCPNCAPWLLGGMLLMGLDSYFPHLSAVSSLWTPLQEAIPVLHWMASRWILPPGWKPNLVSLAPLSHMFEDLVYSLGLSVALRVICSRQQFFIPKSFSIWAQNLEVNCGSLCVMNDISILVLKTQELNPGSQKVDPTLQTSPGPANPLKDRLKSVNYSAFCRPTTKDPSKTT